MARLPYAAAAVEWQTYRDVRRAAACWEIDRRADAEQLLARLHSKPGPTLALLRRTSQGCRVLIELWEGLGRALEARGAWDDAQRALAQELVGVAEALRCDGWRTAPGADLAGLVAGRLAVLRRWKEQQLEPLDAARRAEAEQGPGHDPSAETLRHRRYEAAC